MKKWHIALIAALLGPGVLIAALYIWRWFILTTVDNSEKIIPFF